MSPSAQTSRTQRDCGGHESRITSDRVLVDLVGDQLECRRDRRWLASDDEKERATVPAGDGVVLRQRPPGASGDCEQEDVADVAAVLVVDRGDGVAVEEGDDSRPARFAPREGVRGAAARGQSGELVGAWLRLRATRLAARPDDGPGSRRGAAAAAFIWLTMTAAPAPTMTPTTIGTAS